MMYPVPFQRGTGIFQRYIRIFLKNIGKLLDKFTDEQYITCILNEKSNLIAG